MMVYARKEVAEQFRKIVEEFNINYEKIFLFGSRAGKNHRNDSDWDFLLIVSESISESKKRLLKAKIRVAMHNHFPSLFMDIIILEGTVFFKEKNIVNTISNEAFSAGILL